MIKKFNNSFLFITQCIPAWGINSHLRRDFEMMITTYNKSYFGGKPVILLNNSMMNHEYLKKAVLLIVFFALLTSSAPAQQPNLAKLEKQVQFAVAKARPACVYLNDYDIKTKSLMGNRFSGVVVSADGLILTVAHASFPGMSYRVTFPDGKEYVATGVGRIAAIDASVLKIDEQGKWPFAEMGWSSLLKVNQPCISIAYPASFDNNRLVVRFGYIAEVASTQKANSTRTTCLMEPGDSGGPLFDLQGRVIGLHSSAEAPVEKNFEVPVDLYRKYWNALQQTQDYDGLPIGEEIAPDSLNYSKPAFNNIDDLQPGLLKVEAALKNPVFKITSKLNQKLLTINGTLTDLTGILPANQISGKSYLISKNSMIGDHPSVDIGDGKTITATVIARDEDRDLILLKLPARLTSGIVIKTARTDTLTMANLGEFLISMQPDNKAVPGVVGTTPFDLPAILRAGYSGAGAAMKNGKVMIYLVQNNTAGSAAKLKAGDEVLSINGVAIDSPDKYIHEMRKNKPGEIATLVRKNNGITDTVKLKLGKYPIIRSDHPAERFPGGKSEVRDGLKNVFVQDGVITPVQCGGPVFDIRQRFMGINIARYSRTSTLVITPAEVIAFIRSCLTTAYTGI